jgi:predicted YcjX-like family ATPase
VRVGLTGLARAGKTAFLTSVAANLLAIGAGRPVLPRLAQALAGRTVRVALAPSGAGDVPRFDYAAHLAALAADPPRWPARTDAVALLALDLAIGRAGLASALPPQQVRLEVLDYPGEWLLDLPLLREDYPAWSEATLRRLEGRAEAAEFLAFAGSLPAAAPESDQLAATGHRLYRAALARLRDDAGLSFLQPGRFLMPAPGPEPPWMQFFPARAAGGLGALLARRYGSYVGAVRDGLVSPLFGRVDRLVVLADLLSALHAGPEAFADARAALGAAAAALARRQGWAEWLATLATLRLPSPGVGRVAFAATKSDHVGSRQRRNLMSLMRALTREGARGGQPTGWFAIASVACTEDATWTLEGRAVSAVRGRVEGQGLALSYPGEVPPDPPGPEFWAHRFYSLPQFQPRQMPDGGRGGVPQLGLDDLLTFLLRDVL